MAAKNSIRAAFDKQELDDTVSCCICTDIYTDPKALPCIHTFCMKCLQQDGLSTNKGPGDEMPCPICRRKFKIPSEGFSGLPNNFFIAKLIQVANIPNPSESSRDICDVCLEDNKETAMEISLANMYCTDCKQKLCKECCKQHMRFKANQNHNMISIDEHQLSRANVGLMTNLPPSVCVIHEQKDLDTYCAECRSVQCAFCFIDDHKHHEGSHVSKYVEDFRKQIESNIEAINGCSSKSLMKKAELAKINEDMWQKVGNLKEDIIRRKGELTQLVDSQANSLLQSLSSLNQSKLKNIQIETDEVDSHLSCLHSYSSYCQKLTTKGSASDICRALSDLSVKAAELQEQCQSLNEREIQFFKASFTKSEFEELLEDDNLIGEIHDDCNSTQAITCTSKIALLRKQSYGMDLFKEEIKLERREKETFRLEVERLKMSLNNEQSTNKTLKIDNYKLRQELETQRKALTNLLRSKEQAKEYLENSNTGLSDEEIRNRIVAMFSTLVADLDADQMSDYLIEGLVITSVQWQEILNKRLTKQGRCRELLNLLLTTKNPKAPSVFLNALERNLQWHWILDLLSRRDLLKETGSHESENFRSLSDIMLEEARLEWEKEKKELLEKQIQLQKQNEELQELVDDLRDMCEVDGNIGGIATNSAKTQNPEAISVARISLRSRRSLGRSYVSGKIHLKIVYTPSLHELVVTVVDCRGLDKKNKRCDPYVKLYVLPDDSKTTKRKTAVQYNTLNPVYNETFSFPLSFNDVVTYTLWVSVWKKLKLRPNKLIGEVVIPLEEEPFGSDIDDSFYLERKLR